MLFTACVLRPQGSRNTEVVNMSGMPVEHQGRRVKIYMPARGTGGVRNMQGRWVLEYDKAGTKQGKWVNPLMVRACSSV